MRLFIAIQLSEDMKRALTACMNDLKKQGVTGNYVPAQNLHLTLAFIGEYDEPERVKNVINSIPLPRLRLKLSEKGKFGDLLWAGIQENQKLNTYVKDLRAVYPAHHSDPKVRIEGNISGAFEKSGDERRTSSAYEVGEKEWEDGISGDIGAVLIIIQEWSR